MNLAGAKLIIEALERLVQAQEEVIKALKTERLNHSCVQPRRKLG